MEEWEIFQKTHEVLCTLEQHRTHDISNNLENRFDIERLDELLFKFNIENIYAMV